jgi:hypothetical protein
MANYTLRVEEVLGLTELQTLLQTISTGEGLALRDIKINSTPREGRYVVSWEEKV